MICVELCSSRNQQIVFVASNDNYLAQQRRRELASLKPLGNEDSECVFNFFYYVCE
jgi:hypothetical protein